MASKVKSVLFKDPGSTESARTILKVLILLTIAAAAIASRLFSVIRMFPIYHVGLPPVLIDCVC